MREMTSIPPPPLQLPAAYAANGSRMLGAMVFHIDHQVGRQLLSTWACYFVLQSRWLKGGKRQVERNGGITGRWLGTALDGQTDSGKKKRIRLSVVHCRMLDADADFIYPRPPIVDSDRSS